MYELRSLLGNPVSEGSRRRTGSYTWGDVFKGGNSNITVGLPEQLRMDIEKVHGVSDIQYSFFETGRSLYWTSADTYNYFDESDFWQDIVNQYKNSQTGGQKIAGQRNPHYRKGTQYMYNVDEFYENIKKYIDDDQVDIDKLKSGEQVLLMVDAKRDGSVDSSIKPGDYLYSDPMTPDFSIGQQAYADKLCRYVTDLGLDEFTIGNFQKNVKNFGLERATELSDNNDRLLETFKNMKLNGEGIQKSTIAGVIYLNEDIKNEIKGWMTQYGYYTFIASTALADKNCEDESKQVCEVLGTEYTSDDYYPPVPNQLTIYYDLSSSYSATDNIVSVVLKNAGVEFNTYAEEKNESRTAFLNALILYGTTFISVLVIYLLIYATIIKSRINYRRGEYALMMNIGAGKRGIFRLGVLETLRESIWYIFAIPVVFFLVKTQYANLAILSMVIGCSVLLLSIIMSYLIYLTARIKPIQITE